MMKYTLFAAAFCLLFASIGFAQIDEINIIPKPNSVERGRGAFSLNPRTKILASRPGDVKLADYINDYLKSNRGFSLKVIRSSPSRTNIIILGGSWIESGYGNGAYSLDIDPKTIKISATGDAERLYAVQSLLQLLPSGKGKVEIPAVEIQDSPRFPYRGMHLDVARHFMPVEFVKRYIDLMSQYKFNYFHWHLTDDQGWRIEIKKYPKLTEIGSKRSETHVGNYSPIFKGDGVPVEGFYTQEQIKEVVAYAKARYITVVPEIELPGHASAALAAYPELGCKSDYKYEVKKTWGIFKEVFCPTDETFKFLENVIDETIALFPDSPYVHIGGDEVLKDHWKESPFVQELKKRENLKDEHEVQSYFVQRIEKHVNARGKKIIGWDEILEGGLAPNATVMSWRGMKGGIEAARAKHDVIMTPTDFCYLDYGQGDPATEPINIGGWLPLEKVYQFDPVPKELTADEAKYIIGGQGNIWTEYMKTPDKVEYMALPRMLAIAEAVWSSPENRDFDNFRLRLAANLLRLEQQKVNFRIPEPRNLRNTVLGPSEQFKVENIYSDIPGARVLYTTDGRDPNAGSPEIPAKLMISPPSGGAQTLKTIVVLPSGRTSAVYSAVYVRMPFVEPTEAASTTPGVKMTITTGMEGGTLEAESRTISLRQFDQRSDLPRPFDVVFSGYFKAPVDGLYEFQLDSPGSAALTLGGMTATVKGGGTSAVSSFILPLRAGLHPITVSYSQYARAEDTYRIRWAFKGQNWRNLGGGDLVH